MIPFTSRYDNNNETAFERTAYHVGYIQGHSLVNKKLRYSGEYDYADSIKLGLGDFYVVISHGTGRSFLTNYERDAAHASFLLAESDERHW